MNKISFRMLYIIIICVFLIGACALFYPAISSMWAKQHQLGVIDNYNETINSMDQDEIDAEMAKAVAYNESLLTSHVVLADPFDEKAANESSNEYESLLATMDVMGYIEIPAIDVYLPIYHGTSDDILAEGVGHLEGTSLPVGGKGTHGVLSAHSGLPAAVLFTNLEKLEIGNVFYIHVLGQVNAYQIDQIKVVLPSDTSLLAIDPDQDYVTLVTCTPYGVNTHRLLVRGTRIYPETMSEGEQQTITEDQTAQGLTTVEKVQYLAFSFAGILFLVVLIFVVRTRRERRKTEGKSDDKT